MDVEDIRKLREETGAGILDCKKALDGSGGDYQKAFDELVKKGMSKIAKREGRETPEGTIGTYIHSNGKVGAMVELNCETDFVAKNDIFQQLVKDVCMHITALNPLALTSEELPEEAINEHKAAVLKEMEGKPKEILDKIVDGKMASFYKENCLLAQSFIKDGDKTIQDLLNDASAKTGEKVKIGKFARFEVGK